MSTTTIARTREEAVALAAELERRAKSARDYVLPSDHVHMVPDLANGTASLGIEATKGIPPLLLGINKTAHAQLSERTGVPKAYYDRMLSESSPLLARNVNHWLDADKRHLMVRTLDFRARAVLSNAFRALDDNDLFFHTFKIANAQGAEITRASLTDDRFEMRFTVPSWREELGYDPGWGELGTGHNSFGGRGGSSFVPGCFVSNSETGRGGLTVRPFIFDGGCSNGMLLETSLAKVHLGERLNVGYISRQTQTLKDQATWSEVTDLITTVFDRVRFRAMVKRFRDAGTWELEAPIEAVDAVCKAYDLSDEDKQAILNELISPSHDRDPGRTVLGLLSAVTQRAQVYEESNPEEATRLEAIGGELLVKGRELVKVRVR